MSMQKAASPESNAVMNAAPSLQMRLARPSDADYLYSLRIDPKLNQHLSPPPPSVDAQREFLERYMEREAANREFYFVMKNRATGADCGAVRIYDLRENSFCWGSWILDSGKPRLAAVESALFIYDFAFGVLGYQSSHFDVRKDNSRVISFHERFGAQKQGENDLDIFFVLPREKLEEKLSDLVSLTSYSPIFLRKE